MDITWEWGRAATTATHTEKTRTKSEITKGMGMGITFVKPIQWK